MSIISIANAASETAAPETIATTETASDMPLATAAPKASEAFAMNIGLIVVMVALFYLLLIRPQQKRFKEHADMLSGLERGVKVVTQGGIIGTIDKMISDHEVQIDLGNDMKVVVLRSSIMSKYDDVVRSARPANDSKKK